MPIYLCGLQNTPNQPRFPPGTKVHPINFIPKPDATYAELRELEKRFPVQHVPEAWTEIEADDEPRAAIRFWLKLWGARPRLLTHVTAGLKIEGREHPEKATTYEVSL